MPSERDSEGAGARAEPATAHQTPRWVKLFGAAAAIAVVAVAALHFAGGGMGSMAHGTMLHSMSSERAR